MDNEVNTAISAMVNSIIAGFEKNIKSIETTRTELIPNLGYTYFCMVKITYADEVMTIPVVYTRGWNYVITPADWQGKLPQSIGELKDIDWRINDTERNAIIVHGIPMAFT